MALAAGGLGSTQKSMRSVPPVKPPVPWGLRGAAGDAREVEDVAGGANGEAAMAGGAKVGAIGVAAEAGGAKVGGASAGNGEAAAATGDVEERGGGGLKAAKPSPSKLAKLSLLPFLSLSGLGLLLLEPPTGKVPTVGMESGLFHGPAIMLSHTMLLAGISEPLRAALRRGCNSLG